MDNISKANSDLNKKIEKIEKEIQPALYEQGLDMTAINQEAEKDLNSKVLEITLKIKDQYPELSKYIEEMPVTIPDEKKPEITLKNLKAYYDSLNDVLSKYLLEHPNL
jgi:hypothetical protein